MRQINEVKVVKNGTRLEVSARRVMKSSVKTLGRFVIDLDAPLPAQIEACGKFLVDHGLGLKPT